MQPLKVTSETEIEDEAQVALRSPTRTLVAALPAHYAVLSESGHHPGAHYKRAVSAAALFRFVAAIDELDRALKQDADNPDFHYLKGHCLRRLNRLDDALQSFKQCLRLHPRHVEAMLGKIDVLEAQENYEGVVEACGASGAAAREHILHFRLGCALFHLGRLSDAQRALTRATELDATHAESHFNLGVTLFCLGNFAATIRSCDAALLVDEGYAEAIIYKAKALERLQRRPEAMATLETLSGRQNLSVEVQVLRLRFMLRERRFDDALVVVDQLLAEHRDLGQAHHYRALILAKLGRDGEGRAAATSAILQNSGVYAYFCCRARLQLPESPASAAADIDRAIAASKTDQRYCEDEFLKSIGEEVTLDTRAFNIGFKALLDALVCCTTLLADLRTLGGSSSERRFSSLVQAVQRLLGFSRQLADAAYGFRGETSLETAESTATALLAQAKTLQSRLSVRAAMARSLPTIAKLSQVFVQGRAEDDELYAYAALLHQLMICYLQSFRSEGPIAALVEPSSELTRVPPLFRGTEFSTTRSQQAVAFLDAAAVDSATALAARRRAFLGVLLKKKVSAELGLFSAFWTQTATCLVAAPPIRRRVLAAGPTREEMLARNDFHRGEAAKRHNEFAKSLTRKIERRALFDAVLLLEYFLNSKEQLIDCTDPLSEQIIEAVALDAHLRAYLIAHEARLQKQSLWAPGFFPFSAKL